MVDFDDNVVLEFFAVYAGAKPLCSAVENTKTVYCQQSTDGMQESITRMYAAGEIKPLKMHYCLAARSVFGRIFRGHTRRGDLMVCRSYALCMAAYTRITCWVVSRLCPIAWIKFCHFG